jgi:HSP20 family molecular chaperone IbpA
MRAAAFDFSPLYRSTVGFERLVDVLDHASRAEPMTNWPPYNIDKLGDDEYRITMAVAGFSPEEIEVVQQESNLLVNGQKRAEPEEPKCCIEALPRVLSSRRSILPIMSRSRAPAWKMAC